MCLRSTVGLPGGCLISEEFASDSSPLFSVVSCTLAVSFHVAAGQLSKRLSESLQGSSGSASELVQCHFPPVVLTETDDSISLSSRRRQLDSTFSLEEPQIHFAKNREGVENRGCFFLDCHT